MQTRALSRLELLICVYVCGSTHKQTSTSLLHWRLPMCIVGSVVFMSVAQRVVRKRSCPLKGQLRLQAGSWSHNCQTTLIWIALMPEGSTRKCVAHSRSLAQPFFDMSISVLLWSGFCRVQMIKLKLCHIALFNAWRRRSGNIHASWTWFAGTKESSSLRFPSTLQSCLKHWMHFSKF